MATTRRATLQWCLDAARAATPARRLLLDPVLVSVSDRTILSGENVELFADGALFYAKTTIRVRF
jgi:hypothetical protein